MPESQETKLAFWDHLDELRSRLVRIALWTVVFGIAAFLLKQPLFSIILAPKDPDFVIYRLFSRIAAALQMPQLQTGSFSVKLINTALADQFLIHVRMAMSAGFILISPYVIYQIFRFVLPALYESERRYALRLVVSGYVMFVLGLLLSYFLIFPLTFRFLGTYQVSPDVENLISLQSYIDTLMMLSFMMGVLFEIPVICWILGRLNILTASFMRHYRRHAIVGILLVAAVITPTSDIFTLLLVSLPIYLLYEVSIWLVKK